jgi:DNA-binding response OmpR family regulator
MKILVVDDEPNIAFLTKLVLEKAGMEVVVAASGEEGLELLKKEKPDLIILDIMLPGMNGWETLDEIRKTDEGSSVPVIMFTVKTGASDILLGSRVRGVVDYITKPFDKDDLVRRVKRVLEERY